MTLPFSNRGFSFENCLRNTFLAKHHYPVPKYRTTGTTIAGLVYSDGVILGGDTRSTDEATIFDHTSQKIHYLAPNMYCCGAGIAADANMTTNIISSQLQLHRFYIKREVPVCAAKKMLCQYLFRYEGNIGAGLVLGGVDADGPHLYGVYQHGSSDKLPYITMGTGSLTAMAIFESRWKPLLSEEEGKQLCRDAIASGIATDLASGANVDLCIIRKGSSQYLRGYEVTNKKGKREGDYTFSIGTTDVLTADAIEYDFIELNYGVNNTMRDWRA